MGEEGVKKVRVINIEITGHRVRFWIHSRTITRKEERGIVSRFG